MTDLVKRLRQGCDCSEQVCEMDAFSELAADRIEELQLEIQHQLCAAAELQHRIEELEAALQSAADKAQEAGRRIGELEAENQLLRDDRASRYAQTERRHRELQRKLKELEGRVENEGR